MSTTKSMPIAKKTPKKSVPHPLPATGRAAGRRTAGGREGEFHRKGPPIIVPSVTSFPSPFPGISGSVRNQGQRQKPAISVSIPGQRSGAAAGMVTSVSFTRSGSRRGIRCQGQAGCGAPLTSNSSAARRKGHERNGGDHVQSRRENQTRSPRKSPRSSRHRDLLRPASTGSFEINRRPGGAIGVVGTGKSRRGARAHRKRPNQVLENRLRLSQRGRQPLAASHPCPCHQSIEGGRGTRGI